MPRATTRRQPLASINEVAEYLGLEVQTLYNWRALRQGPPAKKVGRQLRYRWQDVDAWVESQP